MIPRAFAQGEETAMAVPRIAPYDADGVALPHPLSAPDAVLLARLFGQMSQPIDGILHAAEALEPSVLSEQMLGHVLAARYLQGQGRVPATRLSSWLARWPDLPDAPAVAALLKRRDPAAIVPAIAAMPARVPPVPEESEPAGAALRRNPLLDTTLRTRMHEGQFASAERLIDHTRGLSVAYGATLRAELARAMFAANQDDAALALASRAASDAHGSVALADQMAGLAAWRLGRPDVALKHFAAAVAARNAPPSIHAEAAYWAGRASVATGDTVRWRGWFAYAASQRRTFYGQIAARALGRDAGLAFASAVLGEADIAAVADSPAGMRAFALLQIGQSARAEAELRSLAGQDGLARSVMLVARKAGMFDLAADMAAELEQHGDAAVDGDRFPVPRLRPRHGFLLDPALVYALTRIESNFDNAAVSSVGAQGLMQLMPQTAGYVLSGAADGRATAGAARLHDPATNLDLGQRYVNYLAGHQVVAGDLIRLLASYNSGPAAFGRWSGSIVDHGDPLLFIEAIPTDETRQFVQRALAYTWIYAARLHLPAPSLDALAAQRFPHFAAEDGRVKASVLH